MGIEVYVFGETCVSIGSLPVPDASSYPQTLRPDLRSVHDLRAILMANVVQVSSFWPGHNQTKKIRCPTPNRA